MKPLGELRCLCETTPRDPNIPTQLPPKNWKRRLEKPSLQIINPILIFITSEASWETQKGCLFTYCCYFIFHLSSQVSLLTPPYFQRPNLIHSLFITSNICMSSNHARNNPPAIGTIWVHHLKLQPFLSPSVPPSPTEAKMQSYYTFKHMQNPPLIRSRITTEDANVRVSIACDSLLRQHD